MGDKILRRILQISSKKFAGRGGSSDRLQLGGVEVGTGDEFHAGLGHPHLDACGQEGGFQGVYGGKILGGHSLLSQEV
jgi:hypothetical protein